MLFFFECFQPEKRQHQLLLNLFTSFKHLIVFTKTKNFPKTGKISFVLYLKAKGREYFPLCVCVCVLGERLHSWKVRAELLQLVVFPGVSAVIPLKGSGTHFRKQEDFTYQNITALQLKKNAKSLQTSAEFT